MTTWIKHGFRALLAKLLSAKRGSMINIQKYPTLNERSDYKSTWNNLIHSRDDAYMYVAGSTEEAHFAETGKRTVDLLEQFVGIDPTDTILEIGCGVGRVGKLLSKTCAKWIGTDISSQMLTHARQRLSGLDNIQLVELSSVGLQEFEDNTIDVVYCTVVFMHLYEWDRYKYVTEAFRVLKPGGKCFFDNVDIASDGGWQLFMESFSHSIDSRPAQLSMTSSGDELETYVLKAGFEDVSVHRWDGMWVGVVGTKHTSN